MICVLHGESPEIEVRMSARGAGEVTAGDIEAPADLEILNPELVLAHLADRGRLEMTLTIGRGRGYAPTSCSRGSETTIGVIPIDAIFSPVRRVSYDVEAARVGQRTDYDKLRLDVTTDGTLDPKDAIAQAAEILIRQLAIFTDIEKIQGFGEAAAAATAPGRPSRSRTGWRTSRSRSSSSASARTTASSASASRRSATSSRRPRTSSPRSRTSARSRSRK
jgi:DNA-directed RNA polymerase subunit alpha